VQESKRQSCRSRLDTTVLDVSWESEGITDPADGSGQTIETSEESETVVGDASRDSSSTASRLDNAEMGFPMLELEKMSDLSAWLEALSTKEPGLSYS
jgi:hypothetical protein